MLRALYSLFFRLALPLVLLRLWWQGRQSPDTWANWQQRLGYVKLPEQPLIWVHAVSVGETIAAAPLVNQLLERKPDVPILMTAMTATGQARARALFGDRVLYAYSPYDTPGSVKRWLRRVRPRALVIMETELWPNMIAMTHRQQVPIFLINARLSERSARGYQRVRSLAQGLVQSLTWIAAQAPDDARRFVDIGAPQGIVSVTGSVKYDIDVSAEQRAEAAALRVQFGQRPVWIAASTHQGEDEQLLQAHRLVLARHPSALLILVPRHPERFDDVAILIQQQGFNLARRAAGDEPRAAEVYLADTMGELMLLYGVADLAFVGGSMIERGGHNPLEPAAWALPVLTGPHVFNFETIYGALSAGQGCVEITDAGSLAEAVTDLLDNPEKGAAIGRRARAVVDANRGALAEVVEGIVSRV
ncbi:MAG: lipid IV(A) 3-deoxy-D-manno-octulosonic acid transferase [Marinobacter sp.]|nr:lipid IV(A) 3-deoxy-D-manno-octulosonic acid transferase [Marinobacter sp.]